MDKIMAQVQSGELSMNDAIVSHSTREETSNQGGRVVNPRDGGTLFGSDELDPNLFFLLNAMQPSDISEPIQLIDAEDQGYWIAMQLEERVSAHRANPMQDFGYFQTIVENKLRDEQLKKWTKKAIDYTHIRIDAPYDSCLFDDNWVAD
jgi:peptidyl-prolyl cis-trans isomerase SurA